MTDKKSPTIKMPLDDDVEVESQHQWRHWVQQQQCHYSTLLTTLCLATVLSAVWIHHHHLTSRILSLEDRLNILQTVTFTDARHPAAAAASPDNTGSYPPPLPVNHALDPALTTSRPGQWTSGSPASSTTQSTSAQQSAAAESESGSGTGIETEEDYAENGDSGSGQQQVVDWLDDDDDWILEQTSDDEDILKRTRGRRSAQLQDEHGNDDDDVMLGDENPGMRARRATTTRRPPRAKHVKAKSVNKQPEAQASAADNQHLVKAAHFYAPLGEHRQYTSSSNPPVTFTFWQAEAWSANQSFYHLNSRTGIVTIREPGLYLVYAQLLYHDQTGRWSFGVFVNDSERIKCFSTEHVHPPLQPHDSSSASHGVYQHCYTASIIPLHHYDTLSIRCLYGSRTILMQPEFTFWGILKIAPFPSPA